MSKYSTRDVQLLLLDSKTSMSSKLFLFSTHVFNIPNFLCLICFLFSQYQIFLVFTKVESYGSQKELNETIKIFQRLNPFEFPNKFELFKEIWFVFFVISCYFLVLFMLACNILMSIWKKIVPRLIIQKTWSAFIFIHPLVLFFPIHHTCLQILLSDNLENYFGIGLKTQAIQAGTIIIVCLNAAWGILAISLFITKIKTKNILSSKTHRIQLIDFFLKLVPPFLYLINFSEGFYIVILVFDLICCLIKDWTLFRFLPYYKISTLKIASFLHAFTTTFALIALLARFIHYFGLKREEFLLLFLWLILSPLLAKLFNRKIQSQQLEILCHPNKLTNPYYLVHYLEIYQSFSKLTNLKKMRHKVNEASLYQISSINLPELFQNLPADTMVMWHNKKEESIKKHLLIRIIKLLETYIRKNPDSEITRAALAHYYVKSSQNFILAEQIFNQNQNYSFSLKGTFCCIHLLMIHKLTLQRTANKPVGSKNNADFLDIQNYLKIQETYSWVKNIIREQLKFQISFWKALQSEDLHFSHFVNHARKIHRKALLIENVIIQNKLVNSEIYQPLLVLSLYFYLIQNEIDKGQKLFADYNKAKLIKMKKYNNTRLFSDMNSCTTEAIFLNISFSPNMFGAILNSYGPVKRFFLIEKETLMGKSINTLMHPLYAKYHDHFFREVFHSNKKKVPHSTGEINLFLKNGYLMLCKIKLQINYIPNFGICYCALLIPMPNDDRRTVIFKENGIIASFSKNFAKDMNILRSNENSMDIFDLSPDLKRYVEDVNYISEFYTRKLLAHQIDKKIDSPASDLPLKNWKPDIKYKGEEKGEHKDEEYKKIVIPVQNGITIGFYPYSRGTRKELEVNLRAQKPILYKIEIIKYIFKDDCIVELLMERHESLLTLPSPKSDIKIETPKTRDSKINRLQSLEHEHLSTINSVRPLLGQSDLSKSQKGSKSESKGTSGLSFPSHLKIAKTETLYTKKAQNIEAENYEVDSENGEDSLIKSNRSRKDFDFEEVLESKELDINLLNRYFEEGFLDDKKSTNLDVEKAIDTHKDIRKTLKSKKPGKLALFYNYSFLGTLAFLLGFLIWLNIKTSITSKKVENRDQVLQNAYLTAFSMKLANQETRLWAAARQGLIDQETYSFLGTMNKSYVMLNEFYRNLQVSLSNLEPEIQESFYKKEIQVFERKPDKSSAAIYTADTFQLIRKIIDFGIKNVHKPINNNTIEDAPDQDTQFIFDNSFNQLLITSEILIASIKESALNILLEAQNTMLISLLITLSVLTFFILFTLYFVVKINHEFQNFKEILFSLPLSEVNQTKQFLVKFDELVAEDCSDYEFLQAFDLVDITKQENSKISKPEEDRNKNYHRKTCKVSMMQVYLKNYLIFVGILALFVVQAGFMLIYYTQASNKISVMEKHHTSMDTALDYLNTLALASVEAQIIIMDNDTSTIRNIPASQALRNDIQKFNQISALQKRLKKDEANSLYEEQIFFNFSCNNVYSPLYSIPRETVFDECRNYSYSLGRLGLVNVLAVLPIELTIFITNFEESGRDKAAMITAFNTYFEPSLSYIDLASTLLLLLFVYTTQDFEVLVKQLEDQSVILAWLALFVSVLLGSIIWVFLVRSLSFRQFERKLVMAVIPNRLILRNSGLKKEFNKF